MKTREYLIKSHWITESTLEKIEKSKTKNDFKLYIEMEAGSIAKEVRGYVEWYRDAMQGMTKQKAKDIYFKYIESSCNATALTKAMQMIAKDDDMSNAAMEVLMIR